LNRCLAGFLLAALPLFALAQTWPERPVTIVVPFTAGGPVDLVARNVGKALGEELRQPVIIDDKAGAGGTIGASFVARAQPDGYTLLLVVPALTSDESLYPARRYDLDKDFQAVSLIGISPNWLLTPRDSPFRSLDDVVKLAGGSPGKYTYGQGATGGMSHLTAELLKVRKGLDIVNVAYRGNAQALTDLVAGRVDLMFDQPGSSEGYVRSGQLRPLAVTSANRMPGYPGVPTMQEAGFPNFVIDVWYGLAFPKGTPAGIVQAANAALGRTLAKPDLRASLLKSGVTAKVTTPEEFQALIRHDVEQWRAVIEKNHITIQ